MYILTSPIYIPISKRKNFALNLNAYRNAHYQVLNKAKHLYKEIMTDQIQSLPSFSHVTINYILFPGSKRSMDVSNVCCIVDKFFSDALVELGHLPDDNYHFLNKVFYSFGEVDKENPRVQIELEGF